MITRPCIADGLQRTSCGPTSRRQCTNHQVYGLPSDCRRRALHFIVLRHWRRRNQRKLLRQGCPNSGRPQCVDATDDVLMPSRLIDVNLGAQGKTFEQALDTFTQATHTALKAVGKTPVVWEEMVLDHPVTLVNNNTLVLSVFDCCFQGCSF